MKMYNKYLGVLLIYLICQSCSNQIQIIEFSSKKNDLATSENLSLFKNKQNVIIKSSSDKDIVKELKSIKRNINRENLMPSTVLHYAFVHENDTIYATSNLKYWFYKNKVQLYTSKKITNEVIDSLISNVP